MKIIILVEYSNKSQFDKEFDNVETAGIWLAGVEDKEELQNNF